MIATIFYHDIDEVWVYDPTLSMTVNGEDTTRTGIEVEVETESFYHLSGVVAFSYTNDNPKGGGSEDFYKFQV